MDLSDFIFFELVLWYAIGPSTSYVLEMERYSAFDSTLSSADTTRGPVDRVSSGRPGRFVVGDVPMGAGVSTLAIGVGSSGSSGPTKEGFFTEAGASVTGSVS